MQVQGATGGKRSEGTSRNNRPIPTVTLSAKVKEKFAGESRAMESQRKFTHCLRSHTECGWA